MKKLFFFLFALMTTACFAQQANISRHNALGDTLNRNEIAAYTRSLSGPDETTGLYTVTEYYSNGNRKLVGQSLTKSPIRLQGRCIAFFSNGNRKSIANYKGGRLAGEYYAYYPNGRLHSYSTYTDGAAPVSQLIHEMYDSLGVAKVIDGNGFYMGYNDDFTDTFEEGAVQGGKRSGTWKGRDRTLNLTFEEHYQDGQLRSGKSICNGMAGSYGRNRRSPAKFAGGPPALLRFLSTHVSYPSPIPTPGDPKKVLISFVIERDGRLSHIKVINSTRPEQDEETIKIVESITAVEPAKEYGFPTIATLITAISN